MTRASVAGGFLRKARVYLSGPMDFVASRADEKKSGWRMRVGEFLRSYGATVFDPWTKPEVRGLQEYGREDVATTELREKWTFDPSVEGASTRAQCADTFRETMHIDLRMVDVSDFVIAYCPTSVYSVGTPHEIAVARQQHKPVLLVSPPVTYPALEELKGRLAETRDGIAEELLAELMRQVPVKPNSRGIPSLWYMALLGSESFFDGFGFDEYRERFGWPLTALDEKEQQHPPRRPLLVFLESLDITLPQKWDAREQSSVLDDDWLLFDLTR